MNLNDIVFLDFETTGINPYRAQPIQLAAVCIDARKLEIREGSLFNCYIQPNFDEESCRKIGIDIMTDRITEKTGITKEQAAGGLHPKIAWKQFVQYINNFNPTKNKWSAPIKAGFNIDRYDSIIIDRLTGGHNKIARIALDNLLAVGTLLDSPRLPEPYGFGPWDIKNNEEALFKPRDSIDLMRIVWLWTENMQDINSIAMDAIRDWLGISRQGAHNAVKDVMDGAAILIRFMKLHRKYAKVHKFKGSMNETSI